MNIMSDKKKRKIVEASPVKQREESYEDIIKYEENESTTRTPQKDIELFQETCNKMKTLFGEILLLKKSNSDKSKNEISTKQREGAMHFVLLKKLNRLEKYRIKIGRNVLQKEKIRVDTNQLHLQNLLYEASHLKREIHHCYLFKSQDEDIDLVTEEEFYENATEAISRPNKTRTDNHCKRLARLEWELHQRKELSMRCKELTELKKNVTQEISLKIDRINSLVPCLTTLLKATQPLQAALDMNIESEWEMQKSIKLLPLPLYLAYINMSAYAEACEKKLTVHLEGEEDEVRQQEEEELSDVDEDLDSDNEDSEVIVRKARKISKKDYQDLKKIRLLKPHPLSISFILKYKKQSKEFLSIYLTYFPNLRFVTAEAKVLTEESGVTASDVISPFKIISEIYDGDDGLASPNPRTKYQLDQVNLVEPECLNQLLEKGFGRPYLWAQRICGIDFANAEASSHIISTTSLIKNSLPDIVKRLKLRLSTRLNLFKQILALENKNIDLALIDNKFSRVRVLCSLVQWTSLTWEDYSIHSATSMLVKEQIVSSNNVFYRAVITRGSAKLECLISVPTDFPKQNPIWALCVSWNGIHSAQSNPAIKDMEYWINSTQTEDNTTTMKPVLTYQFGRALTSFDIYLETESPFYSPSEFNQEKTFFKSFSKRVLSRPYAIMDNGNNVIFKEFV